MRRIKCKLTYANVMVTILAFIVLGGAAYAATKLPKNSVGTKQIKNQAVTGAKIKKGTITGTNINLAKLGTVPSATNAATASTAGTANALAPPEANRLVGTSGQPPFLDGSSSVPPEPPLAFQPVSFFKDHDGIVHLEGIAKLGKEENPIKGLIFQLPPGYRPASGTVDIFPTVTGEKTAVIDVVGSNVVVAGKNLEGDVVFGGESSAGFLNGITFRAQS